MAFAKNNDDLSYNLHVAASAECNHTGPMTRNVFKATGVNKSEYFISLGMVRKSKSHTTTTTSRGKIHFSASDGVSQTFSNFEDSANSTNSPISTKVNALMVDAIDMDEKFAIMEQTNIEALKKSVDDKNLAYPTNSKDSRAVNSVFLEHRMIWT